MIGRRYVQEETVDTVSYMYMIVAVTLECLEVGR